VPSLLRRGSHGGNTRHDAVMTDSGDRSLRGTFDQDAELYDNLRPGYPKELFDDLAGMIPLTPQARVLEIGCGTGQATRSLARRECSILCVELGDSLAAVARERLAPFPNVQIVVSPFETWDPHGSSFDLVFAATSWHWLDPKSRFPKAASVLKPEGGLGILTTSHVLPDDGDPFFVEVQDAYRRVGEVDTPPPSPTQVRDAGEKIEASGLFHDVRVRRYLWNETYTSEEYVALLNTYSGHRAMPGHLRQELYEDIRRRIRRRPGGCVRKHYLFTLHVAKLAVATPGRLGYSGGRRLK
jgi:SAM-dependent methyltransferase